MAEKKRCMCQLCGPTVHIKLCDNCRGKHSWWKAISQIILATIRECGGVKWRFHMQMCRWEGSGTLPNSYDPHSPALVCFTWDRKAQRDCLTLLGRRKEHWIKSSINHVKSKQWQISLTESMFFYKYLPPLLSEITTGMFLKSHRHADKANNLVFLLILLVHIHQVLSLLSQTETRHFYITYMLMNLNVFVIFLQGLKYVCYTISCTLMSLSIFF